MLEYQKPACMAEQINFDQLELQHAGIVILDLNNPG